MADYQQFRRQAFNVPVVWGEGRPGVAMFLGTAPDTADEKKPFTVGDNMFLRSAVNELRIPSDFLYMNYAVKIPKFPEIDAVTIVEHRRVLFQELSKWVKPIVLIVLGIEALNDAFGRSVPSNEIKSWRKTRVKHTALPGLHIFITHSLRDVVKAFQSGTWDIVREFNEDIVAVFDGNEFHFDNYKVMEGILDA